MSLSSLLVGKSAPVDAELDNLFKASDPNNISLGPSKDLIPKKRKLEAAIEKITNGVLSSKRSKTIAEKHNTVALEIPHKKALNLGRGKERSSAVLSPFHSSGKESDEEEEFDPSQLVHESILNAFKKSGRSSKAKRALEESPEQRLQRTIFVGNLPLEVASKKPLTKQFQRHILSFVPTAKIESLRFRSIPFQAPTSKLEDADGNPKSKSSSQTPKKQAREHEKERSSAWKSKLDEKDEQGIKNDEKKFLNSSQKKKIAYINQEFHSTADTVNAYVVFAHPPDLQGRRDNLPPPPSVLDPIEAARLAVEKCNGMLFMEHMLRVDLVTHMTEPGKSSSSLGVDLRLSIFVGNLDFASKEDDLRLFFDGIVSAERGPPPPTLRENEDEESQTGTLIQKPETWVTRVRIVRDKETQLGKGFAYIQFADQQCVDELMGLEEDKLKFAKRKLRIQRCKNHPKSKPGVNEQKRERRPVATVVVPKGNPALGEKLAGLPKDERKKLKSSDSDRVARRLAKKKARLSMKPGLGKSKVKGKERKRIR